MLDGRLRRAEVYMNEEAYIANGRGKWSEKGVPHKGWHCIDIEDLGEPEQKCEMCESQDIRYIHYMEHAQYPEVLKVGCVCAGHMEEDLSGAKRRDDFMKSRSTKRKTWLSRKWKTSQKGNDFIKVDGYIITIFLRNGSWYALIKSEDGLYEKFSRRSYKTKEEIKIASFDFMTKLLMS